MFQSEVNVLTLTPEEESLIIEKRKQDALDKAKVTFKVKAISTAYAFIVWSELNDAGLTYSTFINTFNYQENDGRIMFEAVQRIHDAAWPQHL